MSNYMCRYLKLGDGMTHHCQSPGNSGGIGSTILSDGIFFKTYCRHALEDGSQAKCVYYAVLTGESFPVETEKKPEAPSTPTAVTASAVNPEKTIHMGDSDESARGGDRLRALREQRRNSTTTASAAVPEVAVKSEPAVEAADSDDSAAKIVSKVGKVLVTKTLETAGGPVGSVIADVINSL